MALASKQEADAYDRMIEAAAELADQIASSGIEINEYDLEELTIHLARHSIQLRKILSIVSRQDAAPRADSEADERPDQQ